jgi:hypothetical protein
VRLSIAIRESLTHSPGKQNGGGGVGFGMRLAISFHLGQDSAEPSLRHVEVHVIAHLGVEIYKDWLLTGRSSQVAAKQQTDRSQNIREVSSWITGIPITTCHTFHSCGKKPQHIHRPGKALTSMRAGAFRQAQNQQGPKAADFAALGPLILTGQ